MLLRLSSLGLRQESCEFEPGLMVSDPIFFKKFETIGLGRF